MKTNTAKMLAGALCAAVCLGCTGQAGAFWTPDGRDGGAAEQLGFSANITDLPEIGGVAMEEPPALAVPLDQEEEQSDSGTGVKLVYDRVSSDCKDVDFPNGVSLQRIKLTSKYYSKYWVSKKKKGSSYWAEQLVAVKEKEISVQVGGRKTLEPWEKDKFEICLTGKKLSAKADPKSAHKFEITIRDGMVAANAVEKLPTDSDSKGITLKVFRPESAAFFAELQDRWAERYAGERIGLSIRICEKTSSWLWGDDEDYILTKDIELPVKEVYSFSFPISEFSPRPKPGNTFSLGFRFRRLGGASLPSWSETYTTIYTRIGESTSTLD